MKAIINKMLVSLATGVSFTLSILAVLVVYQIATDQPAETRSTKVVVPDDLSIVGHEMVPNQEKFTVRGMLENKGDRAWSFVFVDMRVYSGGALMSGCSIDLTDVKPSSKQAFGLICSTTQGRNLPDNISYEIEIPWGHRLD